MTQDPSAPPQRDNRPRGLAARWRRVGQQAIEYTRHAGVAAAWRRVVLTLRQVVPAYAHAGWLRVWPRGDLYRAWMRRTEPGPAALAAQRREQAAFAHRPLISILTPVYNPAPNVLRDTLASVLAQTYDRWELCLVDGASDVPGVAATLAGAAAGDPRLRVKTLPRNLGISGNLNAALAMATGDFVLLLDHDDLLAPDLLFAVVRRLGADPDLDVVYYDEDKVAEDGRRRRDPWFKPPRWSPALLLSTNVLMHSVIRRELLVDLGGFDPAMDGAQDWDLALRLSERTNRLAHLPQVGYHWRQVPGSAARDANAKPWAFDAQRRAVEAHLARVGPAGARVSFPRVGRMRVHWPVSGARASIIIPTKDHVVLVRACLDSIFKQTTYPDYEIVLVDTGSEQPETWAYYTELETEPQVRLVKFDGEFNYSAANNLGAAHASGALLVFLNNDIEVLEPDWLEELLGWAERPDVGLVGAKLLRPSGTLQHAGLVMGLAGHGSHAFDGCVEGTYGPFGSSEWYRDYLAVTGACMAMRRAVFVQLQGFAEAYQIGYGDLELGLRAVSHGLRVIYTPFARLLHHEGASRGFNNPPADVLRAYWQMLPLVRPGDPYFSPNLSSAHRRPSVLGSRDLTREERLETILADFDLLYRPIPLTKTGWAAPGGPAQHFAPAEPAAELPAPEQRVLLISHDLSLTGAPLMLAQLSAYLRRAGYAVTVLSPVDGPLRATLTQSGATVWVEPDVLNDARVLARHLAGRGLLLANTILTWRAVLAAKAAQVPCVWWIHESGFGETMARREAGLARALRAADRVMFASASIAGRYADWVPAERARVIHNGLAWDDSPTLEVAPFIEKSRGDLTVVNLASLEPRKGQDVLLQSVAALPKPLRGRIRLVLLGQALNPAFQRRLDRLIAQARPARVACLGARPRAEALAHLRAADVFVLPSRDEGLPMTLLEAMALGKAIVATTAGGIPEAVHDGVEALLVPPDDPAALTAALTRVLQDEAFRRALGTAAQARFAAAFTLDRFGAAVVSLVQDLIRARQAGDAPGRPGAREVLGEMPVAYRVGRGEALLETGPIEGGSAFDRK